MMAFGPAEIQEENSRSREIFHFYEEIFLFCEETFFFYKEIFLFYEEIFLFYEEIFLFYEEIQEENSKTREIFLFYEEISHFCVAINHKRIELLDVEAGFVIFSGIL